MLTLALAAVVYLVAGYFIRRQLDEMGIPKGMTRGLLIFVCALAVAYGTAALLEWTIR